MLHQRERVPNGYVFVPGHDGQQPAPAVTLRSADDAGAADVEFTFEPVGPNIFRTTFSSRDHLIPPFPSVPRPVPAAVKADVAADLGGKNVVIRAGDVKATVEWSGAPVVSLFLDGVQKPLYRDLHCRSYAVDGDGVAHYSTYRKDTLYVGLGEKAAP